MIKYLSIIQKKNTLTNTWQTHSQPEFTAHTMAEDAIPVRTQADLQTNQIADPDIKGFLPYWRRGRLPDRVERATDHLRCRQWKRIWEIGRSRYPQVKRLSNNYSNPKYCRLVLTSLHGNHAHQGTERTTALFRKRCYWPNIRSDFDRWCKECEGCVVAKAVQPSVRTTVGHHLSWLMIFADDVFISTFVLIHICNAI